jgi:hypothetical protein
MKLRTRNRLERFCHNIPLYLRMFLYQPEYSPLEGDPLATELLCALKGEPLYIKYKYSKWQIESHRHCTK